jgi:DNA-binding NarL/FixJ family response regulator
VKSLALTSFRIYCNTKGNVRVITDTAGTRTSVTLNALKMGVSGIIFKHSGPKQPIETIHRVVKGETWLDSEIIRSMATRT